jgi:hypothetical protein
MMKKVALFGGLLALVGVSAALAQGQFPGYPLATASPPSGSVATLPLTGNEQIPADTLLSGGVSPQTEVINTAQLRAYVLSGSTVSTYIQLPNSTIANLPTCGAGNQGAIASVSNGAAWSAAASAGIAGAPVTTTGAVTRAVICTNTGGATTYAWAYN